MLFAKRELATLYILPKRRSRCMHDYVTIIKVFCRYIDIKGVRGSPPT